MLVMVVFFIAFRWIHLSTPLIRLFLLVLILLLMPTLNFLPVWFALSLLRFRLPSQACLIMEGAEFTENIINGVERPVKAAELFAFTLRVRAGNTDVLTDAEENVRQK